MARVVKNIPEKQKAVPNLYPWKKWLDGRMWELTSGKDFSCTMMGLRSAAVAAAGRLGMSVEFHQRGGKVFVKGIRGESFTQFKPDRVDRIVNRIRKTLKRRKK